MICPATAHAQPLEDNAPAFCPAEPDSGFSYTPPPQFPTEQINATDVSAEQVQSLGKTSSTFSGNVLIERHQLRLRADQVVHDKTQQQLQLDGNIHADTESLSVDAESGWLNLQTRQGALLNSDFYVPQTKFSGHVPQFKLSADKTTVLIDSQFSTCPPRQPDWHLDTAWLELDRETQTGTAKHMVLYLKGIPIFYFPWLQFPLGEERRSGFLMPSFGSSSQNGAELSLPWYWNIAPNQDATFTPRLMNKRGALLATDYRYLTHSSEGNLNLEYLEKDQLTKQERYLVHFDNHSRLGDNTQFKLLSNNASDSEYLDDLGSNIGISNTTHLERNARFNFNNGQWKAGLMAQSYQTLDQSILQTDRPYRRLPQFTLSGREELFDLHSSQFNLGLDSEWVDFDHEANNKPQGSRLHLYPKLTLNTQANAWFFKPSYGLMHTEYDTTDDIGNPLNLDDRSLEVFSLDSGLFFERPVGHDGLLQTLEPRLFFLHIPFEDQSQIPVFDTREQDFSFASLFRENRFNGIDRIGDTRQLTLALSSRIIDTEQGNELMSLSLGRIFYYEDRKVSLDNAIDSDNASDIVSEISGQYDHWRARASMQWNTQTHASDKRSVQVNYAPSKKAVFNLGYRFNRDPLDANLNLEQTDLSFAWPFADNVSLLSRWNYSITDKQDIETLVGLEYESCCWALRLVSQRYLTDDPLHEYDNSIMLQFVLKGFGSISDKAATQTLKRAILGYQPDY